MATPATAPNSARIPLAAITATGLAASLAQILTMRELLVLFYGNELSTGLVFTSWMLWTAAGSGLAGRFSPRLPANPRALAGCLMLLAFVLPLTLLWIRAARLIWAIPLGEILTPAQMLSLSLTATGPFCLVSGFTFTCAWTFQTRQDGAGRARPLVIYLGEAAGAAVGGLLLYFILFPWASMLLAAWITSLLLLTLCGVWLRPKRGTPDVIPGRWPVILWAAVCIPLAATLPALDSLEQTTRSWQWGPQLVTVRDTPYHNLALLKTENQFTLFTNGLWAFSAPDPLTVEPGVHLALLQHPAPRSVLLVGGGIAGQAGEVMKYPAIERIDYVELDPEIVRLAEIYLPDAVTSPVRSDRVHLYHDDAGVFLRRTDRTYDVILINSGDPMNLQLNRFFTLEFYRRLGRLLNAGGIVSFALAVPGNIIGPAQARYLRSIHSTLSAVFPQVMIYPGEDLRFFATNRHDILLNDPQQLAARLRARNLDLTYVREDTLADALNPTRLDYVASILSTDTHAAINRDFTPICYFNNLLLWAVQIHPTLGRILMNLAAVNPLHFWATWLAVVGVVVTFFWSGKPKPAGAVGVSVTVVGGVLMVEELILLLGFQLFAGYVYTQLALIIAAFMTGLALGAALYTGLTLRVGHARHWLLLVQFLLALYLGGTVHILFWLQHRLDRVPGTGTAWQLGLVFIGLALAGGILGGLHFSLAVKTWAGSEVPSGKIAGGLYGLDLVGAASGALLAALVLLPLYGLITTLGLFTLLNLASLAVLGRGKGIGVKGKGIKVEGIKGKGGEREKGGRTNLETNKEPDVERGRMILPPRH